MSLAVRSAKSPGLALGRRAEPQSANGMDVEALASAPDGFVVLGVDLTPLPEVQQLMVCAGGVVCFHLVHGFLQELVVIEVFDRRSSSFITLLNFIGLATMAFLVRRLRSESKREIPLLWHLFMSLCTTTSVGLTFFSMRWLDYPTKTLFKSSRMLLTMLAGVAFLNKRYGWVQWGSAVMILLGLVLFTCGDAIVSSDFNAFGVLMILGALMAEVAKAMTQERVMKKYSMAQPSELIFYDNFLSSFFTFLITICTGDFSSGLLWMLGSQTYTPTMTITTIACMVYMGFNGTSIVTAIVGQFGAVTAAMITTLRKASSILLSFIVFPKPFSTLHVVGGLVFLAGLVINRMKKR
mmetsp:Transcript_19384/g.73285  ORF Transcript_19384/g.73285 Transcript_19384/m.73285 type:complete len:352 (-) Transcript_19384:179-1234(-)